MFMKVKHLLGGICLAIAIMGINAHAQVVINEVMASNGQTLADEDAEFGDWIEIQNRGADQIDLSGWYLTDDATVLRKWEFPSTTVVAGGFVGVFCVVKKQNCP